MNNMKHSRNLALGVLLASGLFACDNGGTDTAANAQPATGDQAEPATIATNRVAIPSSVRANLGISFVTVERRRIEKTLRAPGRFEYLPTARREYRTMLAGRVELLVHQFDHVEAGTTLYSIDSPDWRAMQQDLTEARSTIRKLAAKSDTFAPLWAAHERHEQSLRDAIGVWQQRAAQLSEVREVGGGRIDELAQARSALAGTRAELASVEEKKAELTADRAETEAEMAAATSRFDYLLDSAVAIVGKSRSDLTDTVSTNHGDVPLWSVLSTLDVRAADSGVVEGIGLTNGSWADETVAVLTVVQPDGLRFRASGLQSDLGVLRAGLVARIVPPTPTAVGNAVPLQDTMSGILSLGLSGDPNERTLDLFVVPEHLRPWARPGVSAQLEIVTDTSTTPELAIPVAAVQRDGLLPVIFRRAPDDPNEAIRLEADLGKSDGRWIELLSGVRDGDDIVLDGAFQLMLATSGSIQKGGHFHADGTFHDGED